MNNEQKNETLQKRYYRADEVAIYLGVSVGTVWRYAKQGRLTPKKLSSQCTVFDINEVDNLFLNDEVA